MAQDDQIQKVPISKYLQGLYKLIVISELLVQSLSNCYKPVNLFESCSGQSNYFASA